MKILIVDDSRSIRELVVKYLSQTNFQNLDLKKCGTATEALDIYDDFKPDIVLLDYILPDFTGLEVIKKLRRKHKVLPIIMVTSQDDVKLVTDAMNAGAQNYLLKDRLSPETLYLNIQDTNRKVRSLKSEIKYRAELKRSNEELESFCYRAAHDLQAPLRSIIEFSKKLKEKYIDVFDDQAIKYTNLIINSGTNMSSLIDSLLNYSAITNQANNPEKVNLNNLLSEIVESLQSDIKSRGAEIKIAELPTIECYKYHMAQLFQNLILNALKYSSLERRPEISVLYEETPAYYSFVVKDNGIGIKDKFLKKIFMPFERLHSNKKIAGTGIGLSTCVKIVKMHKGDISVKSQEGVGTEFYFTIKSTV